MIADAAHASKPNATTRILKTRIGLFLLLVLLSRAVFYGFISATGHTRGGNGVYELGLMWSPALAAILTCKLTGLPLNTLSWSR